VRLLLTQIRRRRLHFVAGFASIDDAGTGRACRSSLRRD
jgi:hypothetical protein